MNQKNNSKFPAFLASRRTAIVLSAAIMVLSLLIGGYFSLKNKKDQVYNIYLTGEDNSGKGIKYDLEQIAGEAANLLVIAGRYLDSDTKAVHNLEAKAAELEDIVDQPGKTYRWAQEVLELAAVVDDELIGYDLSEQDETYRVRCMTNIESHIYITENSSYSEAAETFNRMINTYPARFWKQVLGIGKLQVYYEK